MPSIFRSVSILCIFYHGSLFTTSAFSTSIILRRRLFQSLSSHIQKERKKDFFTVWRPMRIGITTILTTSDGSAQVPSWNLRVFLECGGEPPCCVEIQPIFTHKIRRFRVPLTPSLLTTGSIRRGEKQLVSRVDANKGS